MRTSSRGTYDGWPLPTHVYRGRFKLKSRIGAGSFGVVWEADDEEANGQKTTKAAQQNTPLLVNSQEQSDESRNLSTVAVKLEPCTAKNPQLHLEVKLYKHLMDFKSFFTGYCGCHHRVKSPVFVPYTTTNTSLSESVHRVSDENDYSFDAVPEMVWSGAAGSFNVLVMERLGFSLEQLFNICGRKFTLKTAAILGVQMLDLISFFHDRSFIHRDVKPDNFMTKRLGKINPQDQCRNPVLEDQNKKTCRKHSKEALSAAAGVHMNKILIIDFGLAKRFRHEVEEQLPMGRKTHRNVDGITSTPKKSKKDIGREVPSNGGVHARETTLESLQDNTNGNIFRTPCRGDTPSHILELNEVLKSSRHREPITTRKLVEHIQYRDSKNLTGTARYASINTHLGIEQSRRDDLESLSYVLVYFLQGRLPWQGLTAGSKHEKYSAIKRCKLKTPVSVLCDDLEPELLKFVSYSRSLRFNEDPDYGYLFELLVACMKKSGCLAIRNRCAGMESECSNSATTTTIHSFAENGNGNEVKDRSDGDVCSTCTCFNRLDSLKPCHGIRFSFSSINQLSTEIDISAAQKADIIATVSRKNNQHSSVLSTTTENRDLDNTNAYHTEDTLLDPQNSGVCEWMQELRYICENVSLDWDALMSEK